MCLTSHRQILFSINKLPQRDQDKRYKLPIKEDIFLRNEDISKLLLSKQKLGNKINSMITMNMSKN